MTNEYSDGESRRQAVRVEDRVLLSVAQVSPEKYAALEEDFNRGIPPYIQEGFSDIQMYVGTQTALSRIQSKDADLGNFLRHLIPRLTWCCKSSQGTVHPLKTLHFMKS